MQLLLTRVQQVLISKAHKFAFIHIYKTGGDSITEALRPFADTMPVDEVVRRTIGLWTRHVGGLPPRFLANAHRFPKHLDVRTLRERVSSERFLQSFKFAFVRNPWDWQVSLFHFGRARRNLHDASAYRALDGFEDYVRWRLEQGQRTQKSFLTDENGRIVVDFVGRFEILDADFERVCQHIGIEAHLPHINATKRGRYQDYYTPETRDAIGEMFQEDIKEFGYRFDGPCG